MKIDPTNFEKSSNFRWKRKTLIIGKKKPNKNNNVFRWKRKTLIIYDTTNQHGHEQTKNIN